MHSQTTTNQFLAFTDMPGKQFERFQNNTAGTMKLARWESYGPAEILLVKVAESPEHGVATGFVADVLVRWIEDRQVDKEVGLLGATACCFDDGGLAKRPGVSCGPGNTPTLVLEIGLAESQELLDLSAGRWLTAKGSSVTVSVTLAYSMNTPTVTVRQWERDEADVVSLAQEVTVSYSNNGASVSGSMTVPFSNVVGRNADVNKSWEKDFVIMEDEFLDIAEKYWG